MDYFTMFLNAVNQAMLENVHMFTTLSVLLFGAWLGEGIYQLAHTASVRLQYFCFSIGLSVSISAAVFFDLTGIIQSVPGV